MEEITHKLYLEQKNTGKTRAKIAEYFNIPDWKLKKLIAKNGWGRQRPEVKNSEAFLDFNENSCYWAGFIAADGCVTNGTLKIMLQYDDTSHLYKFREFMQSNHTISSNTEKYYRSEIGFRNKTVNEDLLVNFNITPNKSLTYSIPSIPNQYFSYFLRGYFDGDGCICESFSNKNSKTATLYTTITGSNSFIDSIYNRLKTIINITGTIQQKEKVKVIKYNTNASKILLQYLYGNSNIHLDRKYNLYCKIIINKDKKVR